ncbi:type 4 pilus major pilin [Thiolapillus sp.]|uniref:type 4 pilus major pilin n=1 Tax=Thiolapillus sp. TaxID=2017437 RepID=UPI00263AE904|nr:type 4 pilus major pilin [Thiolapillus sp.]
MKTQRGFTMTEMVIALAVFVAATTVTLTGYAAYDRERTRQTLENQVLTLSRMIEETFYPGNGYTYVGISNATLLASGLVPDDMIKSGAIRNVYGGNVTVGASNPAQYFVAMSNIPADSCKKLVSQIKGKYERATINGQVILLTGVVNPNTVATACDLGGPMAGVGLTGKR